MKIIYYKRFRSGLENHAAPGNSYIVPSKENQGEQAKKKT